MPQEKNTTHTPQLRALEQKLDALLAYTQQLEKDKQRLATELSAAEAKNVQWLNQRNQTCETLQQLVEQLKPLGRKSNV